ncbi:MAG: hypothetical protein NTX25_19865, partial [Proteobacteria bacterium]|nr:hypothetical protein [Pseudomonadota bacterium]
QDSDVRTGLIQELMQNAELGPLLFIVQFDATIQPELRQKLEELIARYLKIDGTHHRIEFRKSKKHSELPFKEALLKKKKIGEIDQNMASWWKNQVANHPMNGPRFNLGDKELQLSLKSLAWLVFSVAICSFLLAVISLFKRQFSRVNRRQRDASVNFEKNQIYAIFAPSYERDMSERIGSLLQLLEHLDPIKMKRLAQKWKQSDGLGLRQLLILVDNEMRTKLISMFGAEQVSELNEQLGLLCPSPREKHRAILRILIDIAREIASYSQWEDAPLFLQLMTFKEWHKVAQQISKPRRRILAAKLDKERARWLSIRNDLQSPWLRDLSKDSVSIEEITYRIRSILQMEADQLREQLSVDPEALRAIDSFFSELTLDNGLNNDLAMLILGSYPIDSYSFTQLIENRDSTLLNALKICDPEQLALACFELEPHARAQLWAQLDGKREAVEAALRALQADHSLGKSLRLQARAMRRFLEQQVLLAKVLCYTPAA